jgi:4-amino-4-deoxy-L-arabinose transferase-like glycosyltransferase
MTASVIDPPVQPTAPVDAPAPAKRHRDWLLIATYAALLIGTAFLYIWGLDQNGYANSFYSAAAQAGSQNWQAWFFGSSDAGNSITVDKPPASLWLMGLSVRIFGLSSWSILLPQALLGVATVAVLYASVRRTVLRGWPALSHVAPNANPSRFAHWTALVAGAAFALTPVATLMFRFNNPDALLVFLLVVATSFTLRATERASRGWLILAGVAIGFGFLTKMLQAFIVLPVLVLVYVFATKATWKRKLVDLLIAFAAVIVSSGWYVAIVELTPASMRPYIGGSQTNSLLELIFGYNGFGRITGNETGSVGGGQGGPGVGGESLLRMFTDVSGGMVSWLIPAALVLGTVALVLLGTRLKGVDDDRAAGFRLLRGGVIAWLGWLVITAAVFSFMGGIYHDYYTVALAPAIGGTFALGGAIVWAHRRSIVARITLAVATIGSAVWAVVLLQQAGGLYAVLGWGVLAVGIITGAAFVFAHKLPRFVASVALIAALAAGFTGPAAYSIQTASTAHTGSIVTAGPVSSRDGFGSRGGGAGRQGGFGGGNGQQAPNGQGGFGGNANQPPQGGGFPGTSTGTGTGTSTRGGMDGGMGGLLDGASVSSEVTALLTDNADSFTWVAATTGSQNAASYQLATGYAVMPIGGFNGSDPSPTLAQFTQYVSEGKIHYYISASIGGQQNGGSDAAAQIQSWVEENFTAKTVGNTTVYDLTQSK